MSRELPQLRDESGPSRRHFLKVLGVTGAGAATFGCGPPHFADKLLPQLVQQDDVIPGVSDTYATVLAEAGPEPLAVHAKVRDGRVIMLEGNPDFPTNRGRISALGQSVLQDLYDPDRVPNPLTRSGAAAEGAAAEADPRAAFTDATWEDAIAATGAAVAQGGVVLLTGAVTGTARRFYEEWAAAVGGEHIAYEALELAALRAAHALAYGVAEIPSYEIDRADRIVCFGADFLGTWLAPVELAGRFARARDVDAGRHAKFTFVGPRLSVTGSNSDEWLDARGGSEGLVALAVANVVAGRRGHPLASGPLAPFSPEMAAAASGVGAAHIRALGEELAAADAPIALPPGVEGQGSTAMEAHLAVAMLNEVCGAMGRTVRLGSGPIRGDSASFADMQGLIDRMRSGQVRTLIVAGANPVFTLPAAAGFPEALRNVPNLISLNPHLDETAAAAGWILPSHHALEAWGDAEVAPGIRALAQPLMRPIFETRQREDILLQIAPAGDAGPGAASYAEYLETAWRTDAAEAPAADATDDSWLDALRAGGRVAGGTAQATAQAQPDEVQPAAPTLTAAARSYSFSTAAPPDGTSLVVFPTVQFYDGRGANRSWMQELPDPVTRAAWGSWVEIHPETAAALAVENGDVLRVTSSAGSVEAPAYVHRGIRPGSVGVPIGQGHTAYGRSAMGRGVNAWDLLPANADGASGALAAGGVSVEVASAGRRERLLDGQGNDTDFGREIGEVWNIDHAAEEIGAHRVDLTDLVDAAWDSDPNSPYRWGMTIDLNACTGCGACVTACYAENNIATVGEQQFALRREMSWLRIHRFYEETADGGVHTVHSPMLCQHCGDAPCEPVCPVYATYHNPEGLNVQVYNRCVGTRYCSNNCPYKVRRFNWFGSEFPYPLNLQLNPDITVRDVGVMEKCSFCVQRINRAKLDAKEEGRHVADGEITTACQQGCPTQAIVFGNLKDPSSRVSRLARGARGYRALEEVGTRPAITYLHDITHAELPESGDGH